MLLSGWAPGEQGVDRPQLVSEGPAMAKMPGLLRQRQKIDEAELELDQKRVAARLADIFGGGAETDAADPPQADARVGAADADPAMIAAA